MHKVREVELLVPFDHEIDCTYKRNQMFEKNYTRSTKMVDNQVEEPIVIDVDKRMNNGEQS